MRTFRFAASLCFSRRIAVFLSGASSGATSSRRFGRLNWGTLFLAVLVSLWPASMRPARAVEPLKMVVASTLAKTSAPLSIQGKVGRWFPVAVTLSNTGDAVKGRLELRLRSSGGSERDASYYTDVDLPANQSNKRVWLYARLDSASFDGASVSFSGAFKTMRQSFGLEAVDEGKRLVVTISDSDEKLAYLSSLSDKRLGIAAELRRMDAIGRTGGRAGYVAPLGAPHDLIPDRWIGLEAADLVVLQDFPHTALTPEQLAAVRGYVAGGGALLAAGGADWQRLASSPLADLWPLVPASSGAASSDEVAGMVARFLPGGQFLSGSDRLGGAPVVVSRGALRPDSIVRARLREVGSIRQSGGVLLTMDEMLGPLLVSRDVGAGRVLFLAMDPTKPPFLGWRGLGAMWAQVFASTHAARRLEAVRDNPFGVNYNNYLRYDSDVSAPADATASMLGIIRRLPQLRTPPTSTIAWFLALYVFCLVPLNYFVLRGIDKRELAWVTVPLIAIVFSIGSYAAARRIKGVDLLARHINIVQSTAGIKGAGSGLARADAMLWLYSPRKTTYDIASDNAQMAVGDYLGEDNSAPGMGTPNGAALAVRQSDASRAFRVESSDVKMWDEAKFIGEATLGVGRGVRVQPAGARLKVSNDSPWMLRSAVLVTRDGQVQPLGDIKAGTSLSAFASAKSVVASKIKVPKLPIGASARQRAQLAKAWRVAQEKADADAARANANVLTQIEAKSNLAALFDQPDTKNGAPVNNAGAASTMRLLASAALRAAVGSEAKTGPMVVAWGTEPVAALRIENETPRAQNVTLFVFRLPSSS